MNYEIILKDGVKKAVKPTTVKPVNDGSFDLEEFERVERQYRKHLLTLPPIDLHESLQSLPLGPVEGREQWQWLIGWKISSNPKWIDCTEKEYNMPPVDEGDRRRIILVPDTQKTVDTIADVMVYGKSNRAEQEAPKPMDNNLEQQVKQEAMKYIDKEFPIDFSECKTEEQKDFAITMLGNWRLAAKMAFISGFEYAQKEGWGRWVSVGERKPAEADNQILVTNGNGYFEIVWYSDEEKVYNKPFPFDKYDRPAFHDGGFTHWRPLPSPPTTDKK